MATELAGLGRGWVAAHALGGGLVAKAAQLEEEAMAEAVAEVSPVHSHVVTLRLTGQL